MDLSVLLRDSGDAIADNLRFCDGVADFLLPATVCRVVVDGKGESDEPPLISMRVRIYSRTSHRSRERWLHWLGEETKQLAMGAKFPCRRVSFLLAAS